MALTQVSTAGVKDDAVTSGKIPANAVGSSELADNAVDTAAIADDAITGAKMGNSSVGTDQIVNGAITGAKMGNSSVGTNQLVDGSITGAKMGSGSVGTNQLVDQAVTLAKLPHGTSSNNGKFLRANNGADPSFETVSIPAGTTINNNANNRLITGSGTANTLEGESTATYDGTKLALTGGSGSDGHINMLELKHLNTASSTGGGTGDGPALLLNGYYANNEWPMAKIAADNAGGQWGSGYAGELSFWVHPANGTQTASVIKAADIIGDGTGANLTITDGNLKIGTPNHGIDFSADPSGTLKTLANSFNAELLHDYENGTFTPNIQYDTGTGRYAGNQVSSAVGEYIRIGDLVNFGMKITLTSNQNHSENIHLYFGGLPYNGLHSTEQSSMMNGWGGWACPSNDSNSSYKVHYCFHGYTTVNLRFSQSSGTGGISGFYVWGFYRTAP